MMDSEGRKTVGQLTRWKQRQRGTARSAQTEICPMTTSCPTFKVDLSRPPRERYTEICEAYKDRLREIQFLWNGIFEEFIASTPIRWTLKTLARYLLRRLHSNEENQEIIGISRKTGLPLHQVVAFNTFLDLLTGCTSGGVRLGTRSRGKILHFRNLDWEMDALRDLVIQVEYVRDNKVIASAITYAGYVGVLTGVRPGLSISLNYRDRLNSNAPVRAHRWHQLRMLLGFAPSISSVLRSVLLADQVPTLAELTERFATKDKAITSSPCYLTFCSPSSILILEKDLNNSVIRTSDQFLVVTNHDEAEEKSQDTSAHHTIVKGMAKLEDTSIGRKYCVANAYSECSKGSITLDTIQEWISTQPVLNDFTHFSCIMDPSTGKIVSTVVYEEAIQMNEEFVINLPDHSDSNLSLPLAD